MGKSSLRRARGNMYPWVTHVWNPVLGRCRYECPYCYVQAMGRRFSAVGLRYSGQYRLVEDLAEVRFGKGNTVFVGHMTDLFCDEVPSSYVVRGGKTRTVYPVVITRPLDNVW